MSGQDDREQIKRDLRYKVAERYSQLGVPMNVRTIVVHPGPQAWKEVSLLTFPDAETGQIDRRELRAQTWKAIPPKQGGGYDFTETEYHWHCEDEEIEAVRAFLNEEFPAPGRYQIIQRGTEFGELMEQVERGQVVPAQISKLIELAGRAPDLVSALAASKNGALLAEAVELHRRRDQLDELQAIIRNPSSTERANIHPQLKKMGWIFGGRYVGESTRHQLTVGDVLDIPLLRPDGSLHIVELKGANIPGLIRRYRGPTIPQEVAGHREELPLIVGPEVHEAVGQAMNYLCHLDEARDHILARFKIDSRRTSATALIGNPKFVSGFSSEEIADTFRIYNSHLSRIEVMHYQDLIDNAERSLALEAAPLDDQTVDPPVKVASARFTNSMDDDFDSGSAVIADPWTNSASDPWASEPPF